MTQDVLGELFDMSQPLTNRWIHLLLPSLTNQFQTYFFHDSTERPIQRPKDPQTQKAYYSGKKKQHTVKNNLIINSDSKVVLLTPSCEGSIHDKRIADTIGYCVPSGTVLYQDSGFTLVGINIVHPKKKPKGRELTVEEKENN